MNKTVDQFTYTSPLEYPGKRNDKSYLLVDGHEVIDLSTHPLEALESIDQMLAEKGLPLIDERVPVLAYGRNASPSGAATKLEKYSGGESPKEELSTVPVMKGTLKGHDVVWHGRPGQTGGYFAELINGDEVTDTEVEVWVEFLTAEQLAAIHATEGETYEVSEIKGVNLGDDLSIDVIAYTARQASVLLDGVNGKPIAVAGVERQKSNFDVMNVPQALTYTLGQEAVVAALMDDGITPDSYVHAGAAMPLAGRKARQQDVHTALVDSGLSRPYTHEVDEALHFGRADFNNLPTGISGKPVHTEVLHLMEENLRRIRPTAEALQEKADALQAKYDTEDNDQRLARARRLLDPVVRLRDLATRELTDENRQKRLSEITNNHQSRL
jgi:hypothetical protein